MRTKEYNTWNGMKSRCYNKNHRKYPSYGGRGIKVCDRWLNSFQNFLSDVGLAPSPEHSLDRHPNNHGNYEPGNVRWATGVEQSNNTRRNRVFEFNGESKSIAQWSAIVKIPYDTLKTRFDLGWSSEKALNTPIADRRKNLIPGRKLGAKGKRGATEVDSKTNDGKNKWLNKK